jgi:hypothetical protein
VAPPRRVRQALSEVVVGAGLILFARAAKLMTYHLFVAIPLGAHFERGPRGKPQLRRSLPTCAGSFPRQP